MWEDFKKFAFQGNVLDLAVGVMIGTAFGKIVTSLVENIIMPFIGILLDGVHFETLVSPSIKGVVIPYGVFIQSIFDFFVIAISIFLFIQLLMKFKGHEEEEEVEEPTQEELLMEIRDLLQKEQKS